MRNIKKCFHDQVIYCTETETFRAARTFIEIVQIDVQERPEKSNVHWCVWLISSADCLANFFLRRCAPFAVNRVSTSHRTYPVTLESDTNDASRDTRAIERFPNESTVAAKGESDTSRVNLHVALW